MKIELTKKDCEEIILNYLHKELGLPLEGANVVFETKSKRNYKSEWEQSDYRVTVAQQTKE